MYSISPENSFRHNLKLRKLIVVEGILHIFRGTKPRKLMILRNYLKCSMPGHYQKLCLRQKKDYLMGNFLLLNRVIIHSGVGFIN
jgi:hypothetical protein